MNATRDLIQKFQRPHIWEVVVVKSEQKNSRFFMVSTQLKRMRDVCDAESSK